MGAVLVQQRAELDGEIIALIDEVAVVAQLGQPIGGRAGESLPKLIAFIEQPSVAGRRRERPLVTIRGRESDRCAH